MKWCLVNKRGRALEVPQFGQLSSEFPSLMVVAMLGSLLHIVMREGQVIAGYPATCAVVGTNRRVPAYKAGYARGRAARNKSQCASGNGHEAARLFPVHGH
jgi:hypothetical protein